MSIRRGVIVFLVWMTVWALFVPGLGAQAAKHIKIRKDSVTIPTKKVDTVWRTRTETLTVYVPRYELDSFFVTTIHRDTTTDTVSHHWIIPAPLPFDRDRDCAVSAAPPGSTTTPEPATVILLGTGMLAWAWKRRKR